MIVFGICIQRISISLNDKSLETTVQCCWQLNFPRNGIVQLFILDLDTNCWVCIRFFQLCGFICGFWLSWQIKSKITVTPALWAGKEIYNLLNCIFIWKRCHLALLSSGMAAWLPSHKSQVQSHARTKFSNAICSLEMNIIVFEFSKALHQYL